MKQSFIFASLVGVLLVTGVVLAPQASAESLRDKIRSLNAEITELKALMGAQVQRVPSTTTPVVDSRVSTTVSTQLIPGVKSGEVKELQSALKARGFLTGTVDAAYGPATAEAVRKFQQSVGVTANGVADTATLKNLGVIMREMEVKKGTTSPSCTLASSRYSPTRTRYFTDTALDSESHPEIERYKIQWFSGEWSEWYKPGVNDTDWKDTNKKVWRYFDDHNYEVEACPGSFALRGQSQSLSETPAPRPSPIPSPIPKPSRVRVDLKVNGSDNPSAVYHNVDFDVSWTSSGAVSCIAQGQPVYDKNHGRDTSNGNYSSWSFVWTDHDGISAPVLPPNGNDVLIAHAQWSGYETPLEISIQCRDASGNMTANDTVRVPVIKSETASSCSDSDLKSQKYSSTKTRYWTDTALDSSLHPEIKRYKIQWFSGTWSDWYTPGVNDIDTKDTNKKVWRYFDDHNYEVESCAGKFVPRGKSQSLTKATNPLNTCLDGKPAITRVNSPIDGGTLNAGGFVTTTWQWCNVDPQSEVLIAIEPATGGASSTYGYNPILATYNYSTNSPGSTSGYYQANTFGGSDFMIIPKEVPAGKYKIRVYGKASPDFMKEFSNYSGIFTLNSSQATNSYLPGCSSYLGYSATTGMACNGCTSTRGYSPLTGQSCQ